MNELPRNEEYNKSQRRNKIWITCANCGRAFKIDIPAQEGALIHPTDCQYCSTENVVTITIVTTR